MCGSFPSVNSWSSLLTTEEDNEYVVKAVVDEFPVLYKDKTALVLMGAWNRAHANAVYAALITDSRIWDMKM